MNTNFFKKDFTLMVAGQIISIFGAAILRFALNFYILDITGRADIFALVLALSVVPGIFFSPIGGVIADRVSRRNLMVLFDFTSSAAVLVLLLLIHSGRASIIVIGIIMAVLNTISIMYQPAVQASVPLLVDQDHLTSANGIVGGVNALAALIAPVLGSLLYNFAGVKVLVVLSCVAFFFSAVMELFIHIPFVRLNRHQSVKSVIASDMKDGLHFIVRKNPVIFKIILLAAILNMLVTPLFIVGAPYILQITMHSNVRMYGIGRGIQQLSMIIGAVCAGMITRKMTFSSVYKPVYMMSGLIVPMSLAVTPALLRTGYWPPFLLFSLFCAVVLMLSTVLSIFIITCVQKETPNEMLGKVMAIVLTVSQCAAPLGQALYGLLFERFSNAAYLPVLMGAVSAFAVAKAAKIMLTEKKLSTDYLR